MRGKITIRATFYLREGGSLKVLLDVDGARLYVARDYYSFAHPAAECEICRQGNAAHARSRLELLTTVDIPK